MSLTLLKELFFFVGSVLGILAFLRATIDPLLGRNRERWQSVAKKLSEEDFRDLEYGIWYARMINGQMLARLHALVSDFEDDAAYLKFGPLLSAPYRHHLQRLVRLYGDLREYVQTPYWEPRSEGDEQTIWNWCFNRIHWSATDDSYVEHLEAAHDLAREMRIEYRTLAALSELQPFELICPDRRATARARLPRWNDA